MSIFIIDRKLAELTVYNKTYWLIRALAIPQPLLLLSLFIFL